MRYVILWIRTNSSETWAMQCILRGLREVEIQFLSRGGTYAVLRKERMHRWRGVRKMCRVRSQHEQGWGTKDRVCVSRSCVGWMVSVRPGWEGRVEAAWETSVYQRGKADITRSLWCSQKWSRLEMKIRTRANSGFTQPLLSENRGPFPWRCICTNGPTASLLSRILLFWSVQSPPPGL